MRKEFSFVNWFKGDFKAKLRKNFGDSERDKRIKKKIGLRQGSETSLIKFVQTCINNRKVIPSRKNKRFM